MTLSIETTISPDDILLSLIVGAKDGATRLTGATGKIHRTVFMLKRDYPDLFVDFVFNPNRLFPYCEQIDDALNSFRWNRLISMENIGFRSYTVKAMAEKVYEQAVKPGIDADMAVRLKSASKAFWDELRER